MTKIARAGLIAGSLLVLQAAPVMSQKLYVTESKYELFVTGVEQTIRFYEALGFQIAHVKPDGYTTMRSNSTIVALSPVTSWLPLRWLSVLRNPPLGTEIVLYSDRLEAARSSVEAAGSSPGPITLQPWGDRDFRVRDPEGYYVRVSEGAPVPVQKQPGAQEARSVQ